MYFKYHISKSLITGLAFCFLLIRLNISAQPSPFNFHHLTTSNGLSDPVIRSITSDKYGYVWIATINGLNRFNGYDVKVFQHRDNDTFSLAQNIISSMLCDTEGTLWLAQPKGIYKYDYNNSHFLYQEGSNNLNAGKMIQWGSDSMYISTAKGLVLFNTKTGVFEFLNNKQNGSEKALLSLPVNDFCFGNGYIYIATDSGLLVYNNSGKTTKMDIGPASNKAITKLAADDAGHLWVAYIDDGAMLLQTDFSFNRYHIYSQFKIAKNKFSDNKINLVLADNKNNTWVTTTRQGLFLYDKTTDNFIQYENDPLQPISLATNFITGLYQDKNGFMWAGTEGYGVEYFHPAKNLFSSIQQSFNETPTLPDNWTRTAGEDKYGNLWLGTANGLARFDPQKNKYRVFQNTTFNTNLLHENSIRSILCDDDMVWIGTSGGLNRYHLGTGKMDLLGKKDSLPYSFFWSITKDHDHTIWFGCREGLYRYNNETKKFGGLTGNQLLAPHCKKNVRTLFIDRHNRLWLGFYSGGLLMYDSAKNLVKYFDRRTSKVLSDDIVTSITEDRSGLIWFSTLSGFNSFDINTNSFTHYQNNDANISEISSSLMFDDENRLWVASSRGLYLLDSSRKFIKSFDLEDGLASVDFNNQSAYRTRDGRFIYATLKGFVLFDPEKYRPRSDSISVYLSSFKIYGKEYVPGLAIEQIKEISLGYDERFFSLEMTALNYANPKQNWYAYKLEPFDKNWIYSKERLVNYTNVPGGDYVFHYKTSAHHTEWNVPEKTINIHVATVFYKTWWFSLLMIALFIAGLYWFYKFRIAQKEQLLMLEKKAYSLEKEKALVMYESLKQQLNPHFLFNSLTSLSSLISSSPANAKQFLERMSKIYRYILKSRDSETVALVEEIKLVEIYTQLQQTRFKDGLLLKINVEEEYLHKKIAPVTLQNLVENAIKHNIIDVENPLVIHIFPEDGWLVVRNNLQKKNFVESSNKQGLSNMRSLYYYLSGKELIITEDEQFFTIKVPLL